MQPPQRQQRQDRKRGACVLLTPVHPAPLEARAARDRAAPGSGRVARSLGLQDSEGALRDRGRRVRGTRGALALDVTLSSAITTTTTTRHGSSSRSRGALHGPGSSARNAVPRGAVVNMALRPGRGHGSRVHAHHRQSTHQHQGQGDAHPWAGGLNLLATVWEGAGMDDAHLFCVRRWGAWGIGAWAHQRAPPHAADNNARGQEIGELIASGTLPHPPRHAWHGHHSGGGGGGGGGGGHHFYQHSRISRARPPLSPLTPPRALTTHSTQHTHTHTHTQPTTAPWHPPPPPPRTCECRW
jgi:hypothetical protein